MDLNTFIDALDRAAKLYFADVELDGENEYWYYITINGDKTLIQKDGSAAEVIEFFDDWFYVPMRGCMDDDDEAIERWSDPDAIDARMSMACYNKHGFYL